MAVGNVPYADDEYRLIMSESDEETTVTVPLVVYIGEERHVIGEAHVKGSHVSGVVGPDVSEEVMDLLHMRPEEGQFSLGFTKMPDPFRRSYPPIIWKNQE